MIRVLALAATLCAASCAGSAVPADEPEPTFPTAERVEAITLAGDGYIMPATLELPAAPAPVSCAVFFAGSGPTDRDWRSPLGGGPPTGKRLAAALRARGVGSFRFDKVGSAHNRSGIPRLGLDHHRDEGILAFEFLDDLEECDRVFLLGISEGAIHALRTAAAKAHDPVLGGVIALDPPDRPLIDSLLDQIWAEQLRRDVDRDELAQLLSDFRYAAREGLEPDTAGIAALERIARSLRHPANPRVARELLFVDPLEVAARYTGAALIVSSGDDAEAGARVLAALGRGQGRRRREVIAAADSRFADGDALAPGTAEAIAAFIAAARR